MAGQVFAGLGPDGGGYQRMPYKPPWQARTANFTTSANIDPPDVVGPGPADAPP